MKALSSLAALLVCGTLAGSTLAAGVADTVAVLDPYVRLLPPGAKATGAFLALKNTGDKDVKLVKATSEAAKVVELHNHIDDGGVMKMRQVSAVEVKSKGETALKPGGYHIMLIDLTAPLKEGDKVVLTLGFDDGSSKRIEAQVRKPEAPKAESGSHDHRHKH